MQQGKDQTIDVIDDHDLDDDGEDNDDDD